MLRRLRPRHVSLARPEASGLTPAILPTPSSRRSRKPLNKTQSTSRPVVVGAYINDIQQLDFKSSNYAIDFYVWFR
jgi:hypothetical protein